MLTDPAVAVTDNGSPGKTAGALALHDNVIGGCFLHPIGNRAKPATPRTNKTDFKVREYMLLRSTITLMFGWKNGWKKELTLPPFGSAQRAQLPIFDAPSQT